MRVLRFMAIALAGAALLGAFVAAAQTGGSSYYCQNSASPRGCLPLPPRPWGPWVPGSPALPAMVLNVNQNGYATMRGVVKAVNSDSLVVTSWGGDWTVKTTSILAAGAPARLMGLANERPIALSDIKLGDYVGVQGTVRTDAALSINASVIRDYSLSSPETRDVLLQGSASAMASDSLTLTVGGNNYTVQVNANTRVLDRNWAPVNFTDFGNGDTVRVYGTLSGSVITALVVRDVSLPR